MINLIFCVGEAGFNQEQLPSLVKDILTTPEVCAILGKSAWSVCNMAKTGKLPGARRVGAEWRFTREKLEKFLGCKITCIPETAPK